MSEAEIEEIVQTVLKISGWVIARDIRLLPKYTKDIVNGTIVDLGTALGRTACLFALLNPTSHVYTIDNYETWFYREHPQGTKSELKESQSNNKAAVSRTLHTLNIDNVTQIIADTTTYKWTGGPIDLLFIDANHNYDYVKRDYENWEPFVKSGSYIIFDDYSFGVKEREGVDVREFVDSLNLPIIVEGNEAIIRKP